MANNFDPELIGRLLVVLLRHPLGKLKRDYVPYRWYGDSDRRRTYFLHESEASGLSWGEIQRHLEFMANLGLIKRRQALASTKDDQPESELLNQWQLCSDEEFGAGIPSSLGAWGDRPGWSDNGDNGDNGDSGKGRDGGGGRGGGRGGGGAGGGNSDSGGGQGDGGGRGIAEVLSHPVLFSLPEADFDALIGRLFEGPGAP